MNLFSYDTPFVADLIATKMPVAYCGDISGVEAVFPSDVLPKVGKFFPNPGTGLPGYRVILHI